MTKVAITGASRGLGRVLGKEFQSRGHEVYGLSRSLPVHSPPCSLSLVDVRDLAAYRIWLETVCPQVLVLNAALGVNCSDPLTDFFTISSMVETNFLSNAFAAKWALENMTSGSKVAWISSLSAWVPSTNWVFYGATKAGCEHLFESLRPQFQSQGISVTVVLPGAMDTQFFEQAQVQSPPKNQLINPSALAPEIVEAILNGVERYIAPTDRKTFELFSNLPLREAQLLAHLT